MPKIWLHQKKVNIFKGQASQALLHVKPDPRTHWAAFIGHGPYPFNASLQGIGHHSQGQHTMQLSRLPEKGLLLGLFIFTKPFAKSARVDQNWIPGTLFHLKLHQELFSIAYDFSNLAFLKAKNTENHILGENVQKPPSIWMSTDVWVDFTTFQRPNFVKKTQQNFSLARSSRHFGTKKVLEKYVLKRFRRQYTTLTQTDLKVPISRALYFRRRAYNVPEIAETSPVTNQLSFYRDEFFFNMPIGNNTL